MNALPSAYRTVGDGASSTSSNVQHEFLENALKESSENQTYYHHIGITEELKAIIYSH